MRALIALALLLNAQSANACHRYSRWLYPHAQRCGVVMHARLEPKAKLVDDIKIDPILIPPGWDDEQERREALRRAEHELELSQGGK